MLAGSAPAIDPMAFGVRLVGVTPEPGALAVGYDAVSEMIRVDCYGTWTPSQVDGCFDDLTRLIAQIRKKSGRVRVFVDRHRAVPQSAATTARLKHHIQQDYRPGDRIAVVVDSSLAKMQLRDQLDPQTHTLFLSERAALTWLTAHD